MSDRARGVDGNFLYWRTKQPYTDRSRKSPILFLYDCKCEWYFELVCNVRFPRECETYYDLYIRNQRVQKISKPFLLTTYVLHESYEKPICFNTVIIRRQRTTAQKVRSFSLSGIVDNVPGFNPPRIFQFVIIIMIKDVRPQLEKDALPYRTHSCLECLSNDFGKLLNDDSNKDVQLKCGDHTLKAHKNVLCARSKVFQAMLQSDMMEARTGVVEIQDMEMDVFEKFLRYLYTGKLPEISSDNAKCFYEIGDTYAVEALMRLCAYVLIKNLTLENACEILILADTHFDNHLKDGVITYMVDNKIPLRDENWLSFSETHPKLAVEVLNRAYKSKQM